MTEENAKEGKIIDSNYLQYSAMLNMEQKNSNKLNEFKERIKVFENVKTLQEAKELAQKILPTANEVNRFYVGDAKCVIINRKDLFRISIDSATECICFDFSS